MAVPLGTSTGWNHELVDRGGFGYLGGFTGSFIPFALNEARRNATGDTRPSLAERYTDRQDYLAHIEQAARALVSRRFLIAADVPWTVERAGQEWDAVVALATAGVPKNPFEADGLAAGYGSRQGLETAGEDIPCAGRRIRAEGAAGGGGKRVDILPHPGRTRTWSRKRSLKALSVRTWRRRCRLNS